MKSTKTSNFAFLNVLLILATCSELFFMNFTVLSLLIGKMICFLDSSFVVIWMCGLDLGLPLTMFWIWSIFFALRARKASLILMTSDVFILCLEACTYDFWVSFVTVTSLIFLKYLEIWLTSFWDLAEIEGGIFSILARTGLPIDLLFLLDTSSTLRVNFDKIFCLRVLEFLSVMRKSHLDW